MIASSDHASPGGAYLDPSIYAGLMPIPYYPQLKQVVRSVTACIVLTYLESRFPAPQDSSGRISSLPVTVDLDPMAHDLGVHRRTLETSLSLISSWFRTEAERLGAARCGREFFAFRPRWNPRTRFYSLVGPKSFRRPARLTIRRNIPFLAASLAKCGLSSFPQAINQLQAKANVPDSESSAVRLSSPSSLSALLLRASELSVDRRTVRYPRLRKAVSLQLADKDVLRVRRKEVTEKSMNEGIGPELGEIERRMRDAGSR